MDFIPTSELTKVRFYALGDEENNTEACVDITNKELFRNNLPFANGVYDSRMGTTDNSYICQTCFMNKTNCSGHFGKIQTPYPFISPIFKKEVIKWLKVTCFTCGECVVTIKKRGIDKSQLLNEAVKLSRSSVQKSTEKGESKSVQKNIKCPNCESLHPIVERDPKNHLNIMIRKGDNTERLLNTEIEAVLSKISDDTVLKLGKNLDSHPKKFVLRTLRVPPVTIRPDIKKIKGGRSNNNDLTTILKNMVTLLEKIPSVLNEKLIREHMTRLDNIEMHYYNLIRDVPSGNSLKFQTNTSSSLSSISSRFAKKTGRIRKNILGKRTTYMARSVISVDNIKAYQVGVPKSVAEKIVVPEVVQWYNKERLSINFYNKDKQYPGCVKIVKKNGKEYYVGAINESFLLEEGDTIYRHLMDGDIIFMNRAPTLQASSISGHIVYVVEKGDTFRLSPNITDSFYGGDFDGDAMMAIIPHAEASKNEAWHLAGIPNWCMSLKDGTPSVGIYHDGLIGIFEFTRNGTVINRYNAMRLMSANDHVYAGFITESSKKEFTSHELVSKLLPPINYKKKAGFFKPEHTAYINYDEKDIKVEINRGELIKGRLDKKSVGQGVSGSIFHVLYNEYGSEVALNAIFNMQQMTNIFLMHKGATLTYDDITISKSAMEKVHKQTQVILAEAHQVIDNYKKGKIIPPLGMTVKEFFEQQQLSILNLGDDFLRPVFEDIKHEENNLFKLIVSGSKGKLTNLLQISSSIGQASIGGERITKLFDYERTCPYYSRFDESPQNRGFVTESYTSGVDMVSFIFQSMEARYSIINKALSTSITGEQNRKSVKNLESLVADNHRKVSTNNCIVQYLFGGDGVDVRNNESVSYPTVQISNSDFELKFKCTIEEVDSAFRNETTKVVLEEEWNQLSKDREEFRHIYLTIERQNTKNKMLNDMKNLSVNTERIFNDVLYNNQEYIKENKTPVNPIDVVERVKELCLKIKYSHFNEKCYENKMKLPEHVKHSFKALEINIRSHLNCKKILKSKMPIKVLDVCINRIIYTFKKSLINYGMPVGIISAQSISEPMTQYVLDSHHRTGSSGTKTDFLGRMKEILGAKGTHKMKAPSMIIHLKTNKDGSEFDEYKIQAIANHIEMMKLKQFINGYQVFYEKFLGIIHEDYIHENDMVRSFIKHNPLMKVPSDLINWSIRLEINKEKLIEKNMKLETICFKLFELNPNLYIVNTAENSINQNNIIVRIYIRAGQFKKNQIVNINLIEQFININILNAIIRGVGGIKSTDTTSKIARSKIMEDGSIKKANKGVIMTDGTNMAEILCNEFVDPYQTQSDSIIEINQLLGIEAANNAIVIQLSSMMPSADPKYYRVYADSMTSSGIVTSIDRQGIQNREKNNSLLLLSNSHPLQVLEDIAINGSTALCDKTTSPALMVGSVAKQCSNYNKIIMNKQFIQENFKSVESQLDDL